MNMQKAFYWTENVLRCRKTKNLMKVPFSLVFFLKPQASIFIFSII